jgi:serralysin
MLGMGHAVRNLLRRASLLVVASAGTLLSCGGGGGGGGTPTPTPTPTPLPPLTGAFEYEGIDHVSWWFNQYQGQEGTDSRQALTATGANWAGILVTWYVADRSATTIAADAQSTPSTEALTEAIRDLRGRGLKVMLKPHVDSKDGTWRGDVLPTDTNAWFASYTGFIVGMARLAEQEHVEMLCVGTELKTLSGAAYQAKWTEIIAQVRSVYGGKLTYAANASTLPDEYATVSFWSLLDYAGLDAYVALTTKTDPTRAELVAGWSGALTTFRNWASGHGKPVIFTEIGYRSMNGANIRPWEFGGSGTYDPTEQTDCYYAMFSVFLPERSWMKGAFWWSWDVPVPPASDLGYTPRGKPAGDFLRERYTAS